MAYNRGFLNLGRRPFGRPQRPFATLNDVSVPPVTPQKPGDPFHPKPPPTEGFIKPPYKKDPNWYPDKPPVNVPQMPGGHLPPQLRNRPANLLHQIPQIQGVTLEDYYDPEGQGGWSKLGWQFILEKLEEDKEKKAEEEKQKEVDAFLESQPYTLYMRHIEGLGLDGAMQRYFQNMYDEVYTEYENEVARIMAEGGEPSLKFSEFLRNYDFERRYYQQPYWQRGGAAGRSLTPFTRSANF